CIRQGVRNMRIGPRAEKVDKFIRVFCSRGRPKPIRFIVSDRYSGNPAARRIKPRLRSRVDINQIKINNRTPAESVVFVTTKLHAPCQLLSDDRVNTISTDNQITFVTCSVTEMAN